MSEKKEKNEIIYVFQNNFWEGFAEETDALKYSFFLDLLCRVFDKPVDKTNDPNQADVLLESIGNNGMNSYVYYKPWKYKILFSGESRLCPHYELYDCILWGRKSEGKIVCCPLFIPYMISSGTLSRILQMEERAKRGETGRILPRHKKILAIISNQNSTSRNYLLNILEQHFLVDYAGRYRQNRPIIEARYDHPDFWKEISEYRCVICFENSRDTDYVTEKIVSGMAAGVVPIYWGANYVNDYFNPYRFIHINEFDYKTISQALKQIDLVLGNDTYYREMVNEPIFSGHKDGKTFIEDHVERIVQEIRNVLQIKTIV